MMTEPIRILYIHGGILARGGTEAYMMNYYRNIDRTKVQIDFVVHGFQKGVYDDEIQALGGRIYHVPVKSKDPIGNRKALKEIFLSGKYSIVHSHMDAMNTWNLDIAKKCGIPVRISHSHNTAVQTSNPLKLWLNNQSMKKLPKVATHLFACSGLAGSWLYGNEDFMVIPNAIDLNRFAFCCEKRNTIRSSLGISETDIVLGHVGRFSEQKNHAFFVALMDALVKRDPRFKLVLIGDGHLKEPIRQQLEEKGIVDSVRFVEACPNVYDYYSAFDWFCLPSLHEGLPVVGVEAQANGLRCVVSNTVSLEMDKCGFVTFLPIGDAGIHSWIDYLCAGDAFFRDENAGATLAAAGYSIDLAARNLCDLYISLIS